jgi:hypothetical protein
MKTMTDADLEDLKTGSLHSEELGIDLAKGTDEEHFKWFLANALFGARISASMSRARKPSR